MIRLRECAAATAVALTLLAASGGVAAQTSFAVLSSVGTASPCPSFCGGPGGQFGSNSDGGEGATFSESALSNIDGSGRAEAQLTGQVGLPILKAEAFAVAQHSSRVNASAVGMQGFYVGNGGLSSYSLELSLTGQATGSVRADVLVFRDLDPSSLPMFSADRGTMQFEVIELTGDMELLHSPTLAIPATGTPQNVPGILQIEDLSVGDLFYVWASLSATGLNGTYGDAFNTLNMSFTDATGLSQIAPVPEPEAWMMFAAGCALLVARRRKVRQP